MPIQYSESLDRTFHALGDSSRRAIVAWLSARGPTAAGKLVGLVDSSQPTVSRHLRVLQEAGLVSRRREGRSQVYEMCPETLQEAQAWMTRHLQFWQASLDSLAAYLDKEEPRE